MNKQSRIAPFVRIVATDGKSYPICSELGFSPDPSLQTAPASPSPVGVGATSIGAAAFPSSPPAFPTGEAGAPNLSTYSRCPDCDGPFSYRIRDEDTGCSYPVDDGEHYCDGCDAIWSDDALAVSGWALAERSALR